MEPSDKKTEGQKNIGMTATEAKGEILKRDVPGTQYNINDQAFSQSTKEDFVKTNSNFHHNNEGLVDLDKPSE